MPQQTGQNMLAAYKVEDTFDTPPGDTGGKRIRLNSSQGLTFNREVIQPGEVLSSLLTRMGRLGSGSVSGGYTGDFSVGSWDDFLEALMRSTWAAAVAITEAEMTSITTTTSTIVAAAGSWITEGVRVGDVVRLTEHATAANNDLNLRVTGVTATTITVAGTPLTADASPDSDFTLTILKKLKNGDTPVRRSFYIEEYFADIDQSAVFGGCRISGLRIRGQPNGMATVEWMIVGASGNSLATGSSPYYTDPVLAASIGLVFVDAKIRLGGVDITTPTAFELNLQTNAAAQPVLTGTAAAGVFDNGLVVDGSISVIRDDLGYFDNFTAEDELELHVLLEEPEAVPADCVSIFVPRLKLTNADAPVGGTGAMIETLPFMAGLKDAETGYDETMVTITTSAA